MHGLGPERGILGIEMKFLKYSVAAVSVALGLAALPAAANVVTIGSPGVGTVTCNGATAGQCQGFILGGGSTAVPGTGPTGPGSLSNTQAYLYDGSPASPTVEAGRLDTLLGQAVGTTPAAAQIAGSGNSNGNPDDTFVTSALYILLKIGNNDVFIKNTSGGALTVQYDSFPGTGTGLSHHSEFGSVVPVPAALWLMISGLAGLGFAGRRKQA